MELRLTAHSRFAGDAPPRRARNRAGLPSGEVTNSFARRSAGRAVAASLRRSSAQRPLRRVARPAPPSRARISDFASGIAGPRAVAAFAAFAAKARSCADSGRVAAIAPGRPAPVGTPRRGNFLLLYTSGRGAAFRRGQGVVNAPRCANRVFFLPFIGDTSARESHCLVSKGG